MKFQISTFIILLLSVVIKSQVPNSTWEQISITGDISQIQFINNNIGFCTSYSNNKYVLLKTTNSGNSWKQVNGVFENKIVSYSVINENNIWVTTDGSIYKTQDGGMNWRIYKNFMPTDQTGNNSIFIINYPKIKFFDLNNGVLFTGNGMHKTIDGGKTWTYIQNTPGTANQTDIIYLDNNTFYWYNGSSTTIPIKKTTDGGVTWQSLSMPNISDTFKMDFVNYNVGYINTNGYAKLFKTTDGGSSWNEISQNFSLNKVQFINENEGYAVNPQCLKTTDGGHSWTNLNNNLSIDNIYKSNENIFFTGTKGRIFMLSNNSLNLLNGMAIETKIVSDNHQSIDFYNNNYNFFQSNMIGGNSSKTYYYFKSVIDQYSQKLKTISTNIVDPNSSGHIISGSVYNPSKTVEITFPRPYRSINNSSFVSIFDSSLGDLNYEFLDIEFFNDTSAYGISNDKFYRTTNQGTSWEILLNGNSSNGLSDFQMLNQNEIIIAGRNSTLYKTINGGQTWSTINLSNNTNQRITHLYFINNLIGWAYGNYGALFKTIDGGNNWVDYSQNFNYTITDVQFINENEGWFANGETYHTINGGISWVKNAYAPNLSTYPPYVMRFTDNKTGFAWDQYNSRLFNYIVIPNCPQISSANITHNNGYQLNINWSNVENATNYLLSYRIDANDLDLNYAQTQNNKYSFNITDYEYLLNKDFIINIKPINSQYKNESCTGSFTLSNLSTQNASSKTNIFIYPNPVQDKLYISTDKEIKIIEIYTQDGKKILSSNSKNKTIDTKNLITGLYFINIVFSDYSISNFKIIKK